MLISVISPQRRSAGTTSVAGLICAGLAEQNRAVLLMNSAAHSDSFNVYYGIEKDGESVSDSPASQLLNLVKMGGATKDSVPNYCHAVNAKMDVFSVESGNQDKDAVDEVHKYLLEGAPYAYIVCDIDTDMDDDRTKYMIDHSDVVILVLNSSIKNLKKFALVKKEFQKMIKHIPVITVLNEYDEDVMSRESAAKVISVLNKKAIALWTTIHYNKYIPYCENRGRLELLYDQMKKRTSQAILLDSEIRGLTKQIVGIQSQVSKARIMAKAEEAKKMAE